MKLPREWRQFIESLNSHSVEYLIVGAVAVAHHAIPRYTGDLDIFIRSSSENAERVAAALKSFGLGSLGLKASDFLNSGRVIQLGVHPQRIDLLTAITGVAFEEAWTRRVECEIDGTRVNFIGRDDLIRNKKAVGRPRDKSDLDALGAD